MIQSSNQPVIVLIDHVATKGVYDRSNLNTTDVSKANMRLIHASVYLSQFDLIIKYYPGRLNIVPDALSRLEADEQRDITADNELEHIIFVIEAIMEPQFKERITKGLWTNPKFARTLRLLGAAEGDDLPEKLEKDGVSFHI